MGSSLQCSIEIRYWKKFQTQNYWSRMANFFSLWMNFMEYQNKETEEKRPFIKDFTFTKNIPVPGKKFPFSNRRIGDTWRSGRRDRIVPTWLSGRRTTPSSRRCTTPGKFTYQEIFSFVRMFLRLSNTLFPEWVKKVQMCTQYLPLLRHEDTKSSKRPNMKWRNTLYMR